MGFIRHNVRNAAGRFISRAAARNPYIALGVAAGGTAYRAYNYYNSLPQSQNNSYNTPIKSNTTMGNRTQTSRSTRSRTRTKNRTRTITRTMQPSLGSAKMRSSPGLVVGNFRKSTPRERLMSLLNPPAKFDSKWTFQMEATSGRVTAVTIPVLNRTLMNPIYQQLFTNLTTDTAAQDPTLVLSGFFANQYKLNVYKYLSTMKFYNSSTNTARCRLVWYKPKYDFEALLPITGNAVVSDPLCTTMFASTINPPLLFPVVAPLVGDGITFDNSTPGSNYQVSYDHAGWPMTGPTTTVSSSANTIANLDPTLIPGSPEVRAFVSRYWTTLKSEEFTIEPGNQYNTSLRLRNRIIKKNTLVNPDLYYFKDSSVVGVLYVLGQMVFSNAPLDNTITTGSTQISCIREDTCMVKVDTQRSTRRINLTNPLRVLPDSAQGIINTESDDVDVTYDDDA